MTDHRASRSNERWCSDALEFTCWNGEIMRVAFALDSHDREVISWVATTAGISGERNMMVQCVEQRLGEIRAPHTVQWLTDNGSIFAANRTLEIDRSNPSIGSTARHLAAPPNLKYPTFLRSLDLERDLGPKHIGKLQRNGCLTGGICGSRRSFNSLPVHLPAFSIYLLLD
jgi:transposase InsO family protein